MAPHAPLDPSLNGLALYVLMKGSIQAAYCHSNG